MTTENRLNADIPRTVLKGTGVKTKRKKMRWSSGMFMVIGIMMLVSGMMVTMTLGARPFMVLCMAGLAVFTIALFVKITDLAMRIYYEGRAND